MCSSFLPRAEFSFKELAQALGAAWREQTDKTVGTFQFAGAAQIAITSRPRELNHWLWTSISFFRHGLNRKRKIGIDTNRKKKRRNSLASRQTNSCLILSSHKLETLIHRYYLCRAQRHLSVSVPCWRKLYWRGREKFWRRRCHAKSVRLYTWFSLSCTPILAIG